MHNVIEVGCRKYAETEKLGYLTVTGNKINKRHNEVSVMLGFQADSGGQPVNSGNRKCLIPSLIMTSWVRRQRVGLNKDRSMKLYLGNVPYCLIP